MPHSPPAPSAPPLPDTLAGLRAEAFRRLACGVEDRGSPFRTPTLATIGLDGAPAQRSLVLRAVDAAARRLALHTDRRSAKCAELAADSRAALHIHDPAAGIQLRLSGRAALHVGDAAAEAAWAACPPASRLSYAALSGPGRPVAAPPPAPDDAAGAAAQFALIRFTFDRMEWLDLRRAGHRRARFLWTADGLHETWLVP
ncbi:pyridoxamine 5'-phosphate oxidase family protein [Roseicella frigidaeris]|uniref:Pyridoxamine 5'-phosphate oxidase n=1 Tax=Roseicella frigidaeris TaxID=2230885 RepID=A0A327M7C7_9PROT|nr:pyridoxamine 5'-phosphate oxidase family protein [Roseicella frigidaeris]RAI58377.1 pyridoxamine 5'-phosphate oxidase [Roseicella frigidaeris]